jgi:hypothetical protein
MRLDRALRRPEVPVAALESVALLTAAEISLRLADLPRAARWFGATLEFTDSDPGRSVELLGLSTSERRRLAVLARIARRWPLAPQGACLRHSLAAAHILRSRGPRLRIAVGARRPGEVTAHAWIEVDGTAVTDPGNYSPLLRPGRRTSEPRT